MNDKTKKVTNLGFRPARVADDVQAEISKQDLATKLKIQAAKEGKTLKELITPILETIIK